MIQTDYTNTWLIPSKYYLPDPLAKSTDTSFLAKDNYIQINIDINNSYIIKYLFSIIKGMASSLIGDISFLVRDINDYDNLTLLNVVRFNKFSFTGQYYKE